MSETTCHMPELILASASPRRLELLHQIGVACHVKPVNIPEVPQPEESPVAFVERLAREKACAGLAFAGADEAVLGADTVVVSHGQILGKPKNPADALRMLQQPFGCRASSNEPPLQ